MHHEHQHDRERHAGLDRRRFLRDGAATAALFAAAPTLLRGAGTAAGGPVRDLGPARLAAVAKVPAPRIITRAGWGADESIRKGSPSFASISRLVVHHTAEPGNNLADPAAAVRGIYRYHVQSQGWSDIGYNFLIDEAGRIYEGRWAQAYSDGGTHDGEDQRGHGVIGAHTGGYNTGAVGVALLGNFQYGAQAKAAAVDSLVDLLAWKASAHGIDPTAHVQAKKHNSSETRNVHTIAGHRDYGTTSCPGQTFYDTLASVRERVRRRLLVGLLGYRILSSDGSLTRFGDVQSIGDLPTLGVHGAPVRGAVGTRTGEGAWIVGPDGGIFALGDARFLGSMGGTRLNKPMVGMAATPDGGGYWTVASDGGIFAFGSARFHGSTGAIKLNKPIVGMATTPSGNGYWLVATDGGIFAFGDAVFVGSTGSIPLNQPIIGMAATPSGLGYWLLAADGGIFGFGDALYFGSLPDSRKVPVGGARSIRSSPSGKGYWVLDGAGTVYSFGDATHFGGGVGSRTALDLVPVVRY
ncbi:MAG: N-acetylmuramoyl-L-alanine amidase [Acidimicrobiales bacterium]